MTPLCASYCSTQLKFKRIRIISRVECPRVHWLELAELRQRRLITEDLFHLLVTSAPGGLSCLILSDCNHRTFTGVRFRCCSNAEGPERWALASSNQTLRFLSSTCVDTVEICRTAFLGIDRAMDGEARVCASEGCDKPAKMQVGCASPLSAQCRAVSAGRASACAVGVDGSERPAHCTWSPLSSQCPTCLKLKLKEGSYFCAQVSSARPLSRVAASHPSSFFVALWLMSATSLCRIASRTHGQRTKQCIRRQKPRPNRWLKGPCESALLPRNTASSTSTASL